jgi:hypothetical protein
VSCSAGAGEKESHVRGFPPEQRTGLAESTGEQEYLESATRRSVMTNVVTCKCPSCGAISVQTVNGVMKCEYCLCAIQVAADKEGTVPSTKDINVQRLRHDPDV